MIQHTQVSLVERLFTPLIIFLHLIISLNSLALASEAFRGSSKSLAVSPLRMFGILVSPFFEHLSVLLGFGIVFGFICTFSFKIFAVSHLDRSLPLCFTNAVVENKGVLVFNVVLRKLLVDQSLDFLKNFNVILSDESDSLA